jgi:hypothetical protein
MLRKLVLLVGLVASSRANAFCKSDGFQTYASGYSYCYSSNWYGTDIDPWAAHSGDSTAPWDSNWIYAPPYNPSNPNPTLLLFLPGHGSNADSYTQFMRTAQSLGYYVIGLSYQNGQSLQSMCGSFADCYDEVLEQNVYLGHDNGFYSSLASTWPTSDNSINHRLGNILSALENAHIAGGFPWTQFYNYNTHQVSWNKIIIAGHSEGGATAAWIAKNKPVLAALTFEAPYSVLNASYDSNGNPNGKPTAGPGFTPYANQTPVPPASQTAPVPYLQCAQPSDCTWANNLHITLNKYDHGYNAAGQWAGVNMERAAFTLKPGQQIMMDSTNIPTATSIVGNTWYTVSEAPTKCVGHLATVVDDCYPDWIPQYWNALLSSVLPPQQ